MDHMSITIRAILVSKWMVKKKLWPLVHMQQEYQKQRFFWFYFYTSLNGGGYFQSIILPQWGPPDDLNW